MKKVFKTLAVALTAVVLVSCGDASKDLVGTWKAEPSSVDLTLGEGIPAEFKTMIEEGKKEAVSEASEESDKVSFEFKEDGTMVVSAEGEEETFTFNWTLEGDKLTLDGEIEGQKGKFTLDVVEVSADKLTLALTAEELIAQVKAQMPEAMNEVPAEMDLDAMAKGTSISLSFKK